MKNFIQPGHTVTLAAPTGGVKSGDPVLVGSLFGIAAYNAAETAEVEVALVGVFSLPKETPLAINAGDAVYWDASAKKITKTAAANTLVGVVIVAAGSADASARVRLNGVAAFATAGA